MIELITSDFFCKIFLSFFLYLFQLLVFFLSLSEKSVDCSVPPCALFVFVTGHLFAVVCVSVISLTIVCIQCMELTSILGNTGCY